MRMSAFTGIDPMYLMWPTIVPPAWPATGVVAAAKTKNIAATAARENAAFFMVSPDLSGRYFLVAGAGAAFGAGAAAFGAAVAGAAAFGAAAFAAAAFAATPAAISSGDSL